MVNKQVCKNVSFFHSLFTSIHQRISHLPNLTITTEPFAYLETMYCTCKHFTFFSHEPVGNSVIHIKPFVQSSPNDKLYLILCESACTVSSLHTKILKWLLQHFFSPPTHTHTPFNQKNLSSDN